MKVLPSVDELADIVSKAADDKLATNPILIDVTGREGQAESEAYVVTSAPTARQAKAIAEEIMDQIAKEYKIRPAHIEGRGEGNWVLLDYGNMVIHVQSDEARDEYALERLWADCPRRPLLDDAPRSIFG